MSEYDLDKIERKVRKKVDEKRYIHIKGVEYTAACLAMRYDTQLIEAARVSGLLHDYAKCLEPEEILAQCVKYGLPVSDSERITPFLLHGRLASYYAQTEFGIIDPDIINAINYHTTGRPQMSVLEQIVFTADYIEPGRSKQPGLDVVRQLAFSNLEGCVYRISEDTLSYLTGRDRLIDEMTVKTRDYYKERINGK